MVRSKAAARGVPVSSVIDELVQNALQHEKSSSKSRERRPRTARASAKKAIVTAADAPESVRQLLKSYDPKALKWRVRNDRYAVVVAILTRGGDEAKQWLGSVLSQSEVRALVREYRGSGCAEPDRVKLREQLQLTTTDIPTRPYIGFGNGRP